MAHASILDHLQWVQTRCHNPHKVFLIRIRVHTVLHPYISLLYLPHPFSIFHPALPSIRLISVVLLAGEAARVLGAHRRERLRRLRLLKIGGHSQLGSMARIVSGSGIGEPTVSGGFWRLLGMFHRRFLLPKRAEYSMSTRKVSQ